MGIFEHFPYVNFHELNADWIIKKLKEVEDRKMVIFDIEAGEITAGDDPVPCDLICNFSAKDFYGLMKSGEVFTMCARVKADQIAMATSVIQASEGEVKYKSYIKMFAYDNYNGAQYLVEIEGTSSGYAAYISKST